MHPPARAPLLVAALVLQALSALSMWGVAAAQESIRVIPFGLRAIAERLLPTDRVVVVQRDWEAPVVFYDTRGRELPFDARTSILMAVGDADVVAVVEVDDSTGILTSGDLGGAAGSWVETRLTGSVRDVIRDRLKSRLAKGDRVTIDEPRGGEIRIGGVLVKAGDILPFPPRRLYLVFFRASGDGETYRTVYRPLLIDGDRLVHLPVETSGTNYLHGLPLREATRMIRQVR